MLSAVLLQTFNHATGIDGTSGVGAGGGAEATRRTALCTYECRLRRRVSCKNRIGCIFISTRVPVPYLLYTPRYILYSTSQLGRLSVIACRYNAAVGTAV